MRRRFNKSCLKSIGSTDGRGMKRLDLRPTEGDGIAGVEVEFVDIGKNASGENGLLGWY